MKYLFLLFLSTTFIFIFPNVLNAQNDKVTLSGYMRDKGSGEDLIGATVFIRELKSGVAANIYGFYSVTIPKGTYTVEFSYLGYITDTQRVNLQNNITVSIELGAQSTNLETVEIVAEAENKNVEEVRMSTVSLKMESIKKIPALMGEVDLLRVIQLLPGVQSGGEGSTGFFVRGGGIDQNLILSLFHIKFHVKFLN